MSAQVWAKDGSFEKKRDEKISAALDDGSKNRKRRIRCPKCQWQPRAEDRWSCSCGFVWNTFDTAGICPSCAYQWPWTQCLRCHERSAHKDWYEGSSPEPA